MAILACGKDNILRHQSVFHDRELRKFNPLHASDCIISTSPVELNVISCVAICRQSKKVRNNSRLKHSFKHAACHLRQQKELEQLESCMVFCLWEGLPNFYTITVCLGILGKILSFLFIFLITHILFTNSHSEKKTLSKI